jgi:hypothetical protein
MPHHHRIKPGVIRWFQEPLDCLNQEQIALVAHLSVPNLMFPLLTAFVGAQHPGTCDLAHDGPEKGTV